MSSWYVTYNFFVGGSVGWYWDNAKIENLPVFSWQTSKLVPALQQRLAEKHNQPRPEAINIVFIALAEGG